MKKLFRKIGNWLNNFILKHHKCENYSKIDSVTIYVNSNSPTFFFKCGICGSPTSGHGYFKKNTYKNEDEY